ncbi:MAG: hypothetical protein AAF653_14705 [Chloroflexota bacterium]
MGRVIHTASTGKTRNQLRRTIAELLRHLSTKQSVDEDTKDMVAAIVFSLREIEAGIESSAQAWEKRDYWMKADAFRLEWEWVGNTANNLTAMVHNDDWDEMPQMMIALLPRFADINIAKFTRKADIWAGAHGQLMQEKA